MYKNRSNPNAVTGSTLTLDRIVDNSDIFNSEILYKITKFPDRELKSYVVKVNNLGPSSVSKEIYGNPELSWLITIFNSQYTGIKYKLGDIIRYPDMNDLYKFINS